MCEGDVVICDFVEEMYLAPVEKKTGGDRVHGSITPTLIEETTISVKALKEVDVSLRPKPVEVADLEVGPLQMLERVCIPAQGTYKVAFVVRLTAVVAEKRQ